MKVFSFEKLNAWQKSRELAVTNHKINKTLPDEEKFGPINQMSRCAISVSSNIAKGKGRHSKKDKARFSEKAYGCSPKPLNHAVLSKDLESLLEQDDKTIRKNLTEIFAMLDGLYRLQISL